MIFNSLHFAVFFVIFYVLYLVSGHRLKNAVLFAGSCFFYAYWSWKFLFLLLALTLVNHIIAVKISKNPDRKKARLWLISGICIDLGALGFFKYCNFFIANIRWLLESLGFQANVRFLSIALPLGISFYIFRILSYLIDVYRKEEPPAKRFFDFAVYASFFPLILAGPIQRAKSLLPQISGKRVITRDDIYTGGWLIFYGLFKKVFLADNMAKIADQIFVSNGMGNGILVLLGCYAYAFQIYGDFSGYSDMAAGISRLMGFKIMTNFRLPYFAANPSDFWRRWHTSLSTWFRDYVYIPLGGNRGSSAFIYRNLLLTMAIAGLWHGASWVFVIWGVYHGILLVLHRLGNGWTANAGILKKIPSVVKIFVTFNLVCLGWLAFRSESFVQMRCMLENLFFKFKFVHGMGAQLFALRIAALSWLVLLIEILQYRKDDADIILKQPLFVRYAVYTAMVFLIYLYGDFGGKEFIYLQF